jgi:arsenate reductase-like glutaredoxin family protein
MKKTKLNYKAKNYNLDEVLDKIDIVYSEITVKKANATKARLKESMKLKDKIVKRLSYVSIKKIKIGVEKDKILDAKS